MVTGEINSEQNVARVVGSAIARQRKAKGYTQAHLAELMGIEKETVSRIENGVISPTLVRLSQLAKLLDCDMGDFFKSESDQSKDHALYLAKRMEGLTETQRAILSQFLGKVAYAMERLSENDKQVIEKFLQDVL